MAVGTMLLIVRLKKKAAFYILPFIPIALNVFSLFVASGWSDYRYYWPSMLTAAILIPYTLIVQAQWVNGDVSQ